MKLITTLNELSGWLDTLRRQLVAPELSKVVQIAASTEIHLDACCEQIRRNTQALTGVEQQLAQVGLQLERIATALEQPQSDPVQAASPVALLDPVPDPQATNAGHGPSDTRLAELPDQTADAPAAPEPQVHEVSGPQEYLNRRQIKVKTLPVEDESDRVLIPVAEFLGDRYTSLRTLLGKIKSNMQLGRSFTLNLKGEPQDLVSNVCQLCTKLHEIAFLEAYNYQKSPRYLLTAKPTTLPKAQNFFSGKWLEQYILLKVKALVARLPAVRGEAVAFDYLLNPQVILPNGSDFELDLIFQVNQHTLWIEAKSGDYQQHISKYSKVSRLMGLNYDHAIMVLTDLPRESCDSLSALFGMTVLSLEDLESHLMRTLQTDLETEVRVS